MNTDMKILVIEDNQEICDFISTAFECSWPEAEIITSHQGKGGLELARNKQPNVIILDLGLPDMNGLDVLKHIRLSSNVPVIIITVRGSEADIVKGLTMKADEYIVKPFGQLELIARVKALLRRYENPKEDLSFNYGLLKLDAFRNELTCGVKKISLTPTECRIMRSFMENANQVVVYDKLAEAIWGDTYSYTAETIKVYIRRMRSKLDNISEPQLFIRSKAGVGYSLEVLTQ